MAFAQTVSWVLPGWLGHRRSSQPNTADVSGQTAISDEQLFERVCRSKNGDPASFDLIVTRYRARIVALVYKMLASTQTSIDPEDVAQEAFIDAFRHRATFRHGEKLRPWLYGIAVNRCLDHLRTRSREDISHVEPEHLETVIEADRAISDNPLDILLDRVETDALERGVASLPPKLRAVLILRYLDDMQYEEIAAALSLPVGTVKTNLFRARAELRVRMQNANQE
jgi:RNA polymerase sigma-70 factor (ECF subfamily)